MICGEFPPSTIRHDPARRVLMDNGLRDVIWRGFGTTGYTRRIGWNTLELVEGKSEGRRENENRKHERRTLKGQTVVYSEWKIFRGRTYSKSPFHPASFITNLKFRKTYGKFFEEMIFPMQELEIVCRQ